MERNMKSPYNLPLSQGDETENRIGSSPITSEDLKKGVNQYVRIESIPHREILSKLLEQVEPLDFNGIANPKKAEGFKLGEKHYLVLSVENVLQISKKNQWGMCKNNNFIYLYNGHYWTEIEKESIEIFLGEAAELMGVPKFTAKHYLFREKLFKQFLSTAFLPAPEVIEENVLINLQNGTFQVHTQEIRLRPFDPSDFLTYQLQFEYDPYAKAPLFQAYLDRVLPDVESQKVLAEYLGYVFIKHQSKALKLEKVLILYGSGANGKSVFFEVVSALLGPNNLSSFNLQSLVNENGYYRAKIGTKLVNFASEISSRIDNNALFKQLASGEPVEARLPYGQPFMLKDYAKLIFNCNELPKEVEQTPAFFRRFLIIPFEVTIPPEERDSSLHSKIIETELAGVFNWSLEGLKRLMEQRQFTRCEAAENALNKYKHESDNISLFLAEYDSVISPHFTPLKEIYARYQGYCFSNGFRPCSSTTFLKRLRALGYQSVRKNYGTAVNAEIKFFL
jgi:putative DNA primase/helicase